MLSVLAEGKTARDSPSAMAEDIALLKHAMDNKGKVESALQELEQHLGADASIEDIVKAIKQE